MDVIASEILDFWFIKIKSIQWFKKDNKFDQLIYNKYKTLHFLAIDGLLDNWKYDYKECLALILIIDQFSRNMFRNDKKAFAQDQKTRLIVNDAVYSGYLEAMNVNQRLFMLLPLIHSEEISDHEMAYYLLNKYLREHEGYNEIKNFGKIIQK